MKRWYHIVCWIAWRIVRGPIDSFDLSQLVHPVQFFCEEPQHIPIPLCAGDAWYSAEDMVERAIDAICVWHPGIAVDFQQEKDGCLILLVCACVPSPRL